MQHATDNFISLDHRRGVPHSHEQARLVLRWETRAYWAEICQRLGCSEAVARVVIALWAEWISVGRWTSYSRNEEHYKLHPSRFYTKHLVVSAAEWLDRAGLIHHWVQEEGVRDWQSCMLPKPELMFIMESIIAKVGRPIPAMPRQQIILRNAKGEPIGFRETRETRAMSRQVDEVNEMLLAADTSCSTAGMSRIFNRKFSRGGRWYVIGGAWQQMSEIARGQILIDGQPTIELDYKTQHAAMIFTDAGLSVPADAYDIHGFDRELVKVGFLVLVNASCEKEALFAIAGKDEIDTMAEPDTKDAVRAARSLMKAIKTRHEAILHAFHSDAGAGLMRRDSEITAHVATKMTRLGITCLPLHDSFIVKATARDVLHEVMLEATTLAGLPDIRIELKVPKVKIKRTRKCKADSTISMVCKENPPHTHHLSGSLSVPPGLDGSDPDSFQPDSTIQNLVLGQPDEAVAEELSQAKPNDQTTKTPAAAAELQDETQPSSPAHSLGHSQSGSHAMLKLDLTTPLKISTSQETLQDDATGDSPTGGTDANLDSTTPPQPAGFNPTSMWSQPAWTPKPKPMAATPIPPGVDQMSPFYRPAVTATLNAPENPDPIPMVIDTVGAEESIMDATSAVVDGSNLTLSDEESIQVAETESEEVGNPNQVPVIHTVGDGNLTPENNDLIMPAEISVGSKESIQEESSISMVGGNLNQRVPGIESESGDLLLRDVDLTSGSKEANLPKRIAVQDRSGQPTFDDLIQTSSETKPSILESLCLVSADVSPVSPATDPRFVFDRTPVVLITLPMPDDEMASNTALVERLTPAGREYSSIVTRHSDLAGRRLKTFEPALARLNPTSRRLVEMAISPLTHDDPDVSDDDGEALRAAAWKAIVMSYPVREDFDDAARSEMQLRSYRADVGSLPEPKRREKGPRIPTFGRAATSPLSFEPMKRRLSDVRR